MDMTLDELRASGWILYEIHAGSELYNIADENSDTDIRGMFDVPLYQYLCQRHPTKITINGEQDVVFMEIVTYLKLATEGNPNVVDWLFHPNAEDKCESLEMGELIDQRDVFVTKQFLSRSLAMAKSMLERSKKKRDDKDFKPSWKMLAHARRIVITIGDYFNTGTYNPVLEGLSQLIVQRIKRPVKESDNDTFYWCINQLVEQGIKSLTDRLDAADVPSKFDPDLKDELILRFKTKYYGIEATEE